MLLVGQMKKFIKNIINYYKAYRHKTLIVEKDISMSRSIFSEYVRICRNTQINDSSVGTCSYIGWDCVLNNAEVGSFVSIGPKSEVIYGTHPTDLMSTCPVFYSPKKQCGISFTDKTLFREFKHTSSSKKSVVIGNDVWIGYGARILEGITVNDGAIISANAMVTKDVEPFAIVGGVPAKIIKYRFSDEEIGLLEQFRWWQKDLEWIQKHSSSFLDPEQFFPLIKKILDEERR